MAGGRNRNGQPGRNLWQDPGDNELGRGDREGAKCECQDREQCRWLVPISLGSDEFRVHSSLFPRVSYAN